jgi:hypothetical protein
MKYLVILLLLFSCSNVNTPNVSTGQIVIKRFLIDLKHD